MTRIFNAVIILFLLASLQSKAQTYYTSINNGNWSTASNWAYFNGTSLISPAATAPDSNADYVEVNHNINIFSEVYVKQLKYNAGNSIAYALIHLIGNSPGFQIEINGGSFTNFNGITRLPALGGATMGITANGTFKFRGSVDSTMTVINYGTILCDGSSQFFNDGIIANYNMMNWISSQGASSEHRNGQILNYDTLQMTSAFANNSFKGQAISNYGTLLVTGGTGGFFLQGNSLAYGSTTLLNDGNLIVDQGRLLINTNSTFAVASNVQVAAGSILYLNNGGRHTYQGGNYNGAGAMVHIGNATVNINPVNFNVDSTVFNCDSFACNTQVNLNCTKAKWLSGHWLGNFVNANSLSIEGSGTKYLMGKITNNSNLLLNGTNLYTNAPDTARIENNAHMLTNNPISSLSVNAVIINKGIWNLDYNSITTSNDFYFTGTSNRIFNDSNGIIHLKNGARMQHLSGNYSGTGKLSVDSSCRYSYTHPQLFVYRNDTLNMQGEFFNQTAASALSLNSLNTSVINSIGNPNNNNGNIRYLHIDNESDVLLNGNLKTRNIEFAQGKLLTNGNRLYTEFFNSINADSNKYIVIENGGACFAKPQQFNFQLFPIGTTQHYAPLEIYQAQFTSNLYKLSVQENVYDAYTNDSPTGSAILEKAVNHTWYVQPFNANAVSALTGTVENMNIKLFYLNNYLPNFDQAVSQMCHYTSGAWTYNTNVARGNSNGLLYTTYQNNITSLSPFAVSSGPLSNCVATTIIDTAIICANQSYNWNGNAYNATGIYTDSFITALGCDSIRQLNLTVNPIYNISDSATICFGQSYNWNGNVYNATGIYTDSFITALGCDSIRQLNLTVNPIYNISDSATICFGQSYNWNGNVYNATGIYTDSFITALGCDSIRQLNLTVNPIYNISDSASICFGQSYNWNGNVYNATGIYTDSFSTALGCDSIRQLNLTVNLIYNISDSASICFGQSYNWNGNAYNATGIYTDSFITALGCDSIRQLNLTVNPIYAITDSATICFGQSYNWNGNAYNVTGIYTDSFSTALGCDSIRNLQLTVLPEYFFIDTQTICYNSSITWHGQVYNTAGTYADSLLNVNGCDSVYQLLLTVVPQNISMDTATACVNTGYLWNGNSYFASGIYKDTFASSTGCDSISSLDLTITPAPNNQTLSGNHDICYNSSATVALASSQIGVKYILIDSATNSIVSPIVLGTGGTINLISNPISNNTTFTVRATANAEQSLQFDGVDDFIQTPLAIDPNQGTWEAWISKDDWGAFNDDHLFGNDIDYSFDNSFYLSLHPSVGFHFRYGGIGQSGNTAAFNGNNLGFVNGSWHHVACTWHTTFSGTDLTVFVDGMQVATTTATVPLNIGNHIYFGGSPNTPKFGPGKMEEVRLYNFAKQELDIQADMYDCLSYGTGMLIHYAMQDDQANTIVSDISGNGNSGALINNTAINTYANQSPVNCNVADSICSTTNMPQTFHVTIIPITNDTINQNICSTQMPYSWNGYNIDSSGYFMHTYTNAIGCDSNVTLNVTKIINQFDIYDTICANQTIAFNGSLLNTTGVYMDSFTSTTLPCDSIVYLHLKVKAVPQITTLAATPNVICIGESAQLIVSGVSNDSVMETFSSRKSEFIQNSYSGSIASAYAIATKFIINSSAIADSLWLGLGFSYTGDYQLGLLADNAGTPGALLAQTSLISNAGAGVTATALTSSTALAAGTYWVALINSSDLYISTDIVGAAGRSAVASYAYNGNIPSGSSFGVNFYNDTYALGASITTSEPIPGPITYTWSKVPNVVLDTNSSFYDNPVTSTIYTITVQNNSGCVYSSTQNLDVSALPQITSIASTPNTICFGDTSILSVSSNGSANWEPVFLNSIIDSTSTMAFPEQRTVYTVTVSNGYNCTATSTVSVNVNILPQVTATALSTSVCYGDTATVFATIFANDSFMRKQVSSFTFGNASASSTFDYVNGTKFTLTQSSMVDSLWFNLLTPFYFGDIEMGIFTIDANGKPDELEGNTITQTNATAGRVVLPLITPVTLNPGTYFAVVLTSDSCTIESNNSNNSPGDGVVNTNGAYSVDKLEPLYWSVNTTPEACAIGASILENVPTAANITWTSSATILNPNNDTTQVFSNIGATYTATVTNNNGCSTSNAIDINIKPTPSISTAAASPTTICDGKPTLLTVNAGSNDSVTIYTNARESVYLPSAINGVANNEIIRATKFTLTNTAYLDSLWMEIASPYVGDYRLALYSDNGGMPDNLITQTNLVTNATVGTNAQSISSTTILAPGTFWVALINSADILLKSNFSGANGKSAISFNSYSATFPAATTWTVLSNSNAYGLGASVRYPTTIPGPVQYAWASSTNGSLGNTNDSLDFFPNVNTIYTVTASNTTGCSANNTIQVNVNPTALAMVTTAITQKHLSTEMFQDYIDANCNLICSVLDVAKPSIFDSVTAEVFIDSTQTLVHNTQPYVSRYWHITPKVNGYAKVKLYVTQADFDLYNTNKGFWPALPTHANDNANISNVRITKVSGGVLGASGTIASVVPITNAYWDNGKNYWVIEIAIDSFSYFYIHGVNPNNAPLSIAMQLTGKIQSTRDELTWQVSDAKEIITYEVQELQNGIYKTLASLTNDMNKQIFSFTNSQYKTSIYRVAAIANNGSKTFSNTISLQRNELNSIVMYPNPASNEIHLDIFSANNSNATVKIFDITGKLVRQVETELEKGTNSTTLDISTLASGVYTIKVSDGKGWNEVLQLQKM